MSEPISMKLDGVDTAAAGPAARSNQRCGHPLTVSGLSAGYGSDVFRDVGLTVAPGESVRLSGPNATGKSTLLRCLAGVHPPRTGQIVVCGADIVQQPEEAKQHIGYCASDIMFTYLTGREHLRLAARIRRLPASRVTAVLDRFPGWAVVRGIDKEVRRHSHGMRQQLAVLLGILHEPCLLLLDESSEGFDDDSLEDLAGYLASHVADRRSLIFVEHRDDVAALFPPAHTFQLDSLAKEA